MKVVIISGISGAGKSTWIKGQSWFDNANVHSADSFFMNDGAYKFDASKLGEAHGACMRDFIHGCHTGWRAKEVGGNMENPIVEVVDNTNLSVEEIAPYYAVAKAYGYKVELVTLWVDPSIAVLRNVHNVPIRTLERMYDNLMSRKLPRFWDLKESHYSWDGILGPKFKPGRHWISHLTKG